MQNFSIKILSKIPRMHEGLLSHLGIIKIGDFEEEFMMPIDWWSAQDYQRQWKEGLERIKTHDTSCLVTTVQNMELDPLIFWWILYKSAEDKNTIFIRHNLLYHDNYTSRRALLPPFTIDTCYQYIHPRSVFSESGFKISEWSTTLEPMH